MAVTSTTTTRSDFYPGSVTITTGTHCTGDCKHCTWGCELQVYRIGSTTVVICTGTTSDNDLSDFLCHSPKEEKDYIFIPIDPQIIRDRRKEARKKWEFKSNKPQVFLKRRLQFSKSGWLTRKGRLRKKGKH